MRDEIIAKIREKKLIAIVRGIESSKCVKVAEALYEGGFQFVEVTFNLSKPETFSQTAEAIKAIDEQLAGKVIVGAGTVVSTEIVDIAAKAGAKYMISPDMDVDVIRRTRELGLVSIPGALTASEVKTAYNAGADFVKLFPAGVFGPKYVKALRGPLSQIPLLVVGGVDEKNIRDFLDAGALGAGIGGNLVNKEWIDNGEYDKITALAKKYVENAK